MEVVEGASPCSCGDKEGVQGQQGSTADGWEIRRIKEQLSTISELFLGSMGSTSVFCPPSRIQVYEEASEIWSRLQRLSMRIRTTWADREVVSERGNCDSPGKED